MKLKRLKMLGLQLENNLERDWFTMSVAEAREVLTVAMLFEKYLRLAKSIRADLSESQAAEVDAFTKEVLALIQR